MTLNSMVEGHSVQRADRSSASHAPWIIDSRSFDFGKDGVADFISPYPLQELDTLIDDFNKWIWSGGDGQSVGETRDVMRVARNDIAVLTLYLCQVAFIRHRAARLNRRVEATETGYASLIRYLQNGELPALSLRSILLWPLHRVSMVRWPLRMARSLIERKNIWRIPRSLYRPDRHWLLTARNHLIDHWCIENRMRCVVWDPGWYFEGVAVGQARAEASRWQAKSRSMSGWVREAVSLLDVHLQDSDVAWLEREAATSMAAAYLHLSRLRTRKDLPKRLISASCGFHFDHMMRIAVTDNGGEVIAGEHGCGLGLHASSMPFMNEIANCTTFVCRDGASASLAEAALAEVQLPDLPLPKLHWPRKAKSTPCNARRTSPRGSAKTVLFVPLSVMGETARNGPVASDVTAMDFNARVLALLDGLNLKVVVKPHPASVGPGKGRYEAAFGHRCSTLPFEQEIREADMIVTAVPTSSTILSAINSGLPVIVLSSDVPGLSRAAKGFLASRATYLELTIDERERIGLPVAKLENAVRQSLEQGASA